MKRKIELELTDHQLECLVSRIADDANTCRSIVKKVLDQGKEDWNGELLFWTSASNAYEQLITELNKTVEE